MSLLLIGNVNFISSFTVLALGFALVYSAFNTRLCLSKEVSSSPAGIGGSSKPMFYNDHWFHLWFITRCFSRFLIPTSLNLPANPLTIAPC